MAQSLLTGSSAAVGGLRLWTPTATGRSLAPRTARSRVPLMIPNLSPPSY